MEYSHANIMPIMIEIKPQKVSRRVWSSEFIQYIAVGIRNALIKSIVSDMAATEIKITAM